MSETAPAPPRSRSAIRQAWIERLDRFATSGLAVIAFCRSENVSCHAFYYWKHKVAAESTPANAVPAGRQDATRLLPVRLLGQASPVEVVLPCGTVLRLAPDCDLAFVRSLAFVHDGSDVQAPPNRPIGLSEGNAGGAVCLGGEAQRGAVAAVVA